MNAAVNRHFLVALILGLVICAGASSARAACGTFEVSKGDVKIQNAEGKISEAPVGSKICSGETVIAADAARAKIHMEDGNELNISPNSKIKIEIYQYDVVSNKKKVMLNILKGKVRATTVRENMYNDKAKDGQANTFQVRTKSAVAGVRGTDFLTSFDPATLRTEVVTFRGKVEVGMPGPGGTMLSSVQVAVGQKTIITGGQAPAIPKALPEGELKQMNTESRPASPVSSNTSGEKTPGPVAAEPSREPASPALSGSMITPTDLGTNPSLPPNVANIAMPPTTVVPVQIPVLPQQINDVLTSQKSSVAVKLVPK